MSVLETPRLLLHMLTLDGTDALQAVLGGVQVVYAITNPRPGRNPQPPTPTEPGTPNPEP